MLYAEDGWTFERALETALYVLCSLVLVYAA